MTIAVGLLCTNGILMAADTGVVTNDWKRQNSAKVGTAYNRFGAFALANASNDGDAANALSVKILNDLERNNYREFGDVEAVISDHMTYWHSAYGQIKPPDMQFVLGAVIGGFPRLYFCAPPNTVYHKTTILESVQALLQLIPWSAHCSRDMTTLRRLVFGTSGTYSTKPKKKMLCAVATRLRSICLWTVVFRFICHIGLWPMLKNLETSSISIYVKLSIEGSQLRAINN